MICKFKNNLKKMYFSEDFINKFKTGNYLYTDRTVLMDEINKMSYCQFYDFIKSHFTISYIVEISLPGWFTILTKKCSSCNNNMNITPHNSERHYYNCNNCKKNYDFDNYDINDYGINKFMNILKT